MIRQCFSNIISLNGQQLRRKFHWNVENILWIAAALGLHQQYDQNVVSEHGQSEARGMSQQYICNVVGQGSMMTQSDKVNDETEMSLD